jgi:hypothetical protein
MICYQCGHRVKGDFANFCDNCGADLNERVKPKASNTPSSDKVIDIHQEMDRVTNLFILWNFNIAASFIFYIIHMRTDDYGYLFLIILFMLIVSWMLLLIKLHDIAVIKHEPRQRFLWANFGLPLLGTFYYFSRVTKK